MSEWSVVYFPYCDGASFSGDRDEPVDGLYFQGRRILSALMEKSLDLGLGEADEVLFTGCSAGGLTLYLHADDMAAYLPKVKTVKSAPTSGYFLASPNIKSQGFLFSLSLSRFF